MRGSSFRLLLYIASIFREQFLVYYWVVKGYELHAWRCVQVVEDPDLGSKNKSANKECWRNMGLLGHYIVLLRCYGR